MQRLQRRALLSIAAGSAVSYFTLQLTGCVTPAEEEEADPSSRRRASGGRGDEAIDETIPGADTPAPGGVIDERNTPSEDPNAPRSDGGSPATPDAASPSMPDAARATVTLYDTNAVALYFDGGQGPYTGIIRVAYVIANAPLTLEFWHGHGGVQHRFTLLPEHFAALKRLEKVTLETTTVEDHKHKLYVDPVSTVHRVPGAMPVVVPV